MIPIVSSRNLSGFVLIFCLLTGFNSVSVAGDWSVTRGPNTDSPGEMIAIKQQGQWVARLVFGEGQMKPYLHVYGAEGELLTNGGLNKEGRKVGAFPHHRGIFIGWSIGSELGRWDLWHMNRGGTIEVTKVQTMDAHDEGVKVIIDTVWLTGKTKQGDKMPLLNETRTLHVSRPAGQGKKTRVDLHFQLKPVRDIRLQGDLQHAGIHFRASNEVNRRNKETSYLLEPDGKTKGSDLRWCRFLFPIGERWYTSLQLNAPGNPVEQLSTRSYGRFGYFFKKAINKGETLDLNYRFVIQPVEAPANAPKQSPAQIEQSRQACQAEYAAFVKELGKE